MPRSCNTQIGELLDTFRDSLRAHFEGERQNGAGEGLLTAVAMDARSQRDVELYDVGFEPEEMAESCIAGAEIVRRQPGNSPTDRIESPVQRPVIFDRRMFGELNIRWFTLFLLVTLFLPR